MKLRYVSIFAAMALLTGAAPRGETILWRIAPVAEGGEVTHLDLSLTFPGDSVGETLVRLPTDWGGQSQLWRALHDFDAGSARIEPGTDPSELILHHAPGAPVTLSWKLGGGPDAPPPKAGGNDYRPRFAPDHFFVIGFTALPWPETVSSGDMARVEIRRPDGLALVSDLDHAPGGRLAFADLAQSALFGGNLRISDAGGGARLAINGSFDSITDTQWTETFTRIARAQQRYWKAKEEDFLVTVISEPAPPERRSFGGTGLGDAFSIFALSNTGLDDITGLIAHEMMHGWIPGRIGRMPDENEAIHYWLSEGFTEWATFRVLARDGIWSPEQFAAAFNSAAAAFDTSAFREADAETMAAGFWTNPDMGRLPYQKGMLIAAWLDAKVREKTKGKRDLDDVLLRMQKMARKDDTALAYDLLVRAVRKVARWDVSAELETMAMQGGPVVLPEDLFAPCGRIVVEPRPLWDRGFDFSATAAAGWKIQGVTEGSNAWDAGLRNGMELRQWSEDSRDRETMAEKTAVVTQGDGVRAITWQPVSKETRDVRRLDLASGLDGAQLAACRKRLGGT